MTRYLTLGLLCVAAVIAYVQRSAISVPSTVIQHDLHLDDGTMGLVMAVWYWSYAALQVPSGWLADRWGSRRTLAAYALVWSLLTGAAGFAADATQMLVLWGLMGAAQAGIFPCAAKAIGVWFDETQHARASGLLGSSMALGIALAPGLTAQLLTTLSWQHVFVVYALPGVLWAAAYCRPDSRAARGCTVNDRGGSHLRKPARKPFNVAVVRPAVSPGRSDGLLRHVVSAISSRDTPPQPACRGTADGLAGASESGCLWALAGGYVSDAILRRTGQRRLSRQGIAVAGMSVCAALFLAARTIDDPNLAVLLMSLGAFAATFGGISGYAVAIQFGGRHVGTVFSVMNMCGNVGAGLFPLIVGQLLEAEYGWDRVIDLVAGIFMVDAVLWALLNPHDPLPEIEAAS